jgi:hypothetical protein
VEETANPPATPDAPALSSPVVKQPTSGRKPSSKKTEKTEKVAGKRKRTKKRSGKSKIQPETKKSKHDSTMTHTSPTHSSDESDGSDESVSIDKIELSMTGKISDLLKLFPPYDRTYQHDPMVQSMRPVFCCT